MAVNRGQFKKGQSGNPAGRKPRTDTEKALRAQIKSALPGVIETLIESANAGDTSASRLLIERVLPSLRPVDQPVRLALGTTDLGGATSAVLEGLGKGTITPSQAAQVSSAITSAARVKELSELEARIVALEAALAGKDDPLSGD